MDRFLPDGNTEIIFDLTDNPQHIYDNETHKEIQTCRHAPREVDAELIAWIKSAYEGAG